ATEATGHRKRPVLLRNKFPISRTSRFSRDTNSSKEKKKTLPRGPPRRLRFGVALGGTWSPKDLSPVRVGENIKPLPLFGGREGGGKHDWFAFGRRLASGTDFSDPLGPTTHVQLLFTWNPSRFILKVSLGVFATTTKSHRGGFPAGSRPGALQPPTAPSYSLGVNFHGEALGP
ncbi:hypothetical protein JTE90_009170, partial [Oedothorax gibbosus]